MAEVEAAPEPAPVVAGAADPRVAAGKTGLPLFVKLMIAMSALLAGLAFTAAMMRSRRVDLPVLATVPAFAMQDQNGKPVSPDTLRGTPFIADFIFLSCTASCPKLTARMKGLHDQIEKKGLTVKLVSITVDPENDGPAELKAYAAKYGAKDRIWTFLTGPLEELDRVVVKGFKVQYEKVKPVDPDATIWNIMHGDWFVLVDGQGRIRGYYDSHVPEKLEAILKDAEFLAKNPKS
jgi:protein SCO1/2